MPVIVNGVVSVSDNAPLFVIVTGAIATLPALVAANASVAGDAVRAGPDPLVTTMSVSMRGRIW